MTIYYSYVPFIQSLFMVQDGALDGGMVLNGLATILAFLSGACFFASFEAESALPSRHLRNCVSPREHNHILLISITITYLHNTMTTQ